MPFSSTDRPRFAVDVNWLPEPNEGSDSRAPSWGAFSMRVDGLNVVAHLDPDGDGARLRPFTWYLAPLVMWLLNNWNALMHEERTPQPLTVDLAAEAAELQAPDIAEPPLNDLWQEWSFRHSLDTAREGGLMASTVIRRIGEVIEISWNHNLALAGSPEGVVFPYGSGGRRFDIEEVARPLWAFLTTLVAESNDWGGPWAPAIRVAFQRACADDRERRTLRTLDLGPPDALESTVRQADVDRNVSEAWLAPVRSYDSLPVLQSSLADSLIQTLDRQSVWSDLASIVRASALRRKEVRADAMSETMGMNGIQAPDWMQGRDAAARVSEELGLTEATPVDVDQLLSVLGVRSVSVPLLSARAASACSESVAPTVFLQTSRPWQPSARRFWMAHETYHILCDRGPRGHVAGASGLWAPEYAERRANAFAAYLLMPPSAVNTAWRCRNTDEVRASVGYIATIFQVGPFAAAHHLCNLRLISRDERDDVLAGN